MNIPDLFKVALLATALNTATFAQQLVASADLGDDNASASSSSVVAATQPVVLTTEPEWQKHFDRFVDLREMDFSLRYRSVFDGNNAHEFNQGQNRSILDGRFKFDEQGKYGVVFHASSGKTFNWAYANFIGGGNQEALALDSAKATPRQVGSLRLIDFVDGKDVKASYASGGWAFSVRRLYLDLEPVKGIEVQYGSLDINRGASSEITTYDNDGYIAGERVSLKRPHNLFFNEVSVTYAYLGDLYTPNFFERGQRLAHNNYRQFLLRKEIAKRVNASFDYTSQQKIDTLHEAAEAKIGESRIFDSVRFEAYQRLNTAFFEHTPVDLAGGNGFGITVAKKASAHLSFEAGMANIDLNSAVYTQVPAAGIYGLGVNGDQYGIGNRFFVRPTIKLTPYLDATGYYTHLYQPDLEPNQIIWNKQALNAGLVFDMKKAFFHEKAAR